MRACVRAHMLRAHAVCTACIQHVHKTRAHTQEHPASHGQSAQKVGTERKPELSLKELLEASKKKLEVKLKKMQLDNIPELIAGLKNLGVPQHEHCTQDMEHTACRTQANARTSRIPHAAHHTHHTHHTTHHAANHATIHPTRTAHHMQQHTYSI